MTIDLERQKKWTVENSIDKSADSTSLPQYPHEILVKLFSSNTYSNLAKDIIPLKENTKVLEIGCMGANNLRFFGQLEGVSERAKQIAVQQANESGKTISQWLDDLITKNISNKV